MRKWPRYILNSNLGDFIFKLTTLEEAIEITTKFLEKRGFPNSEIIDVKDKIYKWHLEAKSSETKFAIELSKSDGMVLKFEVT